jgi:hypothetical protein
MPGGRPAEAPKSSCRSLRHRARASLGPRHGSLLGKTPRPACPARKVPHFEEMPDPRPSCTAGAKGEYSGGQNDHFKCYSVSLADPANQQKWPRRMPLHGAARRNPSFGTTYSLRRLVYDPANDTQHQVRVRGIIGFDEDRSIEALRAKLFITQTDVDSKGRARAR